MTIASSVSKTPTYACNGVTTSFPYGFKILEASDMVVILESETGAQTTLTLDVDYSITGVGAEAGGTINTFTGYATGNKITGVRVPSFLQSVDLQNQGAFFAQVIEDALDLAAMRDQALRAATENSIRAPETEAVNMVLPSATARANKYLIFDANGQPTYINSQIDARYYGALAADPTTRPDGSARQAGDAYFNTVSLGFRVFSGVTWQNAIPPAALTLVNYTETSATSKSTFTIPGGYTVGAAFAYLNGVLLAPDEVVMNGTTVVLSSNCGIGDEFRLVSYSPFSVADTLSRSSNLNDLPNKPTALTNLGFSAFVQGLLALADAIAFRNAIGLDFGATAPLASQATAEAGSNNTDVMTALRVRQAIPPALNASGSAPIYACRAWVNFDGATGTIRASGNVTSVTRTSTGTYTVTFTTAMPDANYSVVGSAQHATGAAYANVKAGVMAAGSVVITTTVQNSGNPTLFDFASVFVTIFR